MPATVNNQVRTPLIDAHFVDIHRAKQSYEEAAETFIR
jgi:hypothetical protein